MGEMWRSHAEIETVMGYNGQRRGKLATSPGAYDRPGSSRSDR